MEQMCTECHESPVRSYDYFCFRCRAAAEGWLISDEGYRIHRWPYKLFGWEIPQHVPF